MKDQSFFGRCFKIVSSTCVHNEFRDHYEKILVSKRLQALHHCNAIREEMMEKKLFSLRATPKLNTSKHENC